MRGEEKDPWLPILFLSLFSRISFIFLIPLFFYYIIFPLLLWLFFPPISPSLIFFSHSYLLSFSCSHNPLNSPLTFPFSSYLTFFPHSFLPQFHTFTLPPHYFLPSYSFIHSLFPSFPPFIFFHPLSLFLFPSCPLFSLSPILLLPSFPHIHSPCSFLSPLTSSFLSHSFPRFLHFSHPFYPLMSPLPSVS